MREALDDKIRELKKEGERLEDLGDGTLILQNPDSFCFGIDAVLLAWFAAPALKPKHTIVEIGTGTGIIPLLLTKKSKARKIYAYEIQDHMADMAERSIRLNGLTDRIEILSQDVREQTQFRENSIDILLSNPPYFKAGAGLENPNDTLRIARHEVTLTAADLFHFAGKTLKEKGKFFLVHRPDRLTELILLAEEKGLVLKRLCMVHPRIDKEANLVLCAFVKGGKPYLHVDPPIIVYDGEAYTEKIHTIYGTDGPSRIFVDG